jgi:hypothetical protein
MRLHLVRKVVVVPIQVMFSRKGLVRNRPNGIAQAGDTPRSNAIVRADWNMPRIFHEVELCRAVSLALNCTRALDHRAPRP